MKKLRIALLIYFLIAAAVFGYYRFFLRASQDRTAPVITADTDSIEASVHASDEELLEGMMAVDAEDGNVTEGMVVISKSKLISKGTVKVNYAAFDSSENVGLYTRTLKFTDYVSPRFSSSQPFRILSSSRASDIAYVTAEDCVDGDLTKQIRVYYDSAAETDSSALMQMQITNSLGDSSMLKVTIEKQSKEEYAVTSPSLSDYIVYTTVGNTLDFTKYINGTWSNGRTMSFENSEQRYSPDNMEIDSSKVDFNTPGVYQVVYTLTEFNWYTYVTEDLGSVTQYVVVEE